MTWLETKARSAKIGTMPMMVQVHGASKVIVGKRIRFREMENGPWNTAIVRRVDADGYFQADRH